MYILFQDMFVELYVILGYMLRDVLSCVHLYMYK